MYHTGLWRSDPLVREAHLNAQPAVQQALVGEPSQWVLHRPEKVAAAVQAAVADPAGTAAGLAGAE